MSRSKRSRSMWWNPGSSSCSASASKATSCPVAVAAAWSMPIASSPDSSSRRCVGSRGEQHRLALGQAVGDVGDDTLGEALLGVPEGDGVARTCDVGTDLCRGHGQGRERHREPRALGAVVLDGAAHRLAELAHDQQAEPAAAVGVGRLAVDIGLEERVDQVLRDAGAVVTDGEPDRAAGPHRTDVHVRAAVAQGVRHEVVQHLGDPHRVADDHRVRCDVHGDVCVGAGHALREQLLTDVRQRHALEGDVQLVALGQV